MNIQTSKPKETTFGFKYVAEGKKCRRCGKYMPIHFYLKHRQSTDGYEHFCCFCRRPRPLTKEKRLEANKYLKEIKAELGVDEIIFKPLVAKATDKSKPKAETTNPVMETTKTMTPVTDMLLALQTADDNTLLAEIRRRGYSGTLQVQRIETIAV